jgi:Lipocalin-like domain
MASIGRICFVALLIVTGAYGSRSQAAESIVGSWRLVSWVEVETESKSVHSVFGDNPTGVITYTPDGRCRYLSLIRNGNHHPERRQMMPRQLNCTER